jgi:hypothetical protein
MATITKLQVDVDNEKLLIGAKTTGQTTVNGNIRHHKFTKVYIDTVNTFNCVNEFSSSASVYNITTTNYDKDSTGEDGQDPIIEVPFSAILSDDIPNELLFVWLQEDEYDNADPHNRLTIDKTAEHLFGLTLSVKTFYDLLLNNINIKNECSCDTTCSDVDIMLAWNGFNLAKTLQNYRQMIYYWQVIHKRANASYTGSCNCNS